jgi:hypothetical protein
MEKRNEQIDDLRAVRIQRDRYTVRSSACVSRTAS